MKEKSRFGKRDKKQFPVTSDVCLKLLAKDIPFRMATDVKSMIRKKEMATRIKANNKGLAV